MPLVYLPDAEALFLWGEKPSLPALSILEGDASRIAARILTPHGVRVSECLKLPLLRAATRLAVIPMAELEALPALHFGFQAPDGHVAVVRQLGAPATWDAAVCPAELLSPILRAAADAARRIAMAEQIGATSEREPIVAAARDAPAAKRASAVGGGKRRCTTASAREDEGAKAKGRPRASARKSDSVGSSKR